MSNTLKNSLKRNFSQIPNALIEDNTLSDRARFVFCYMASRPDGWTFYNDQISGALNYTRKTLQKYITELVDGGWLIKIEQKKLSDGRFTGNDYVLLGEKKA